MKRRTALLLGLIVLLAAGAGGYAWLKAPYAHATAAGVAREFLTLLQEGQLEQAYELTLKRQSLVGRDLADFQPFAARQLCSAEHLPLVGEPHPPQSNGNRLRRWLSGHEVEMPSVSLRFEKSSCLVTVELRRDGERRWRVFYFQSRAG
ncbi:MULTISPECIES: hypothetical protein [unclassified Pseudomonas]|uniref:hypothetical protein n=1 Tax=unclassified Pseudomonas TaxID=196821 RepID=UPI00244B7DED|nr:MULTISPECIES: hypothetical protein [unclassified Pseudomonas]MDG9924874.1 hypothetical protein [Pseudomonas sp. GD04045]MDH0036155.1 hypothetical protein [Pseudomonas sp. GD04019]